jgi:hypothetical protein
MLYWLNACSTAVLDSIYQLDRSDPVSVEQATGKPIKVRSKVTLRFAGAYARDTAIVVSVAMSYGKLRVAGFAIVRTKTSQVQIGDSQPPIPTLAGGGRMSELILRPERSEPASAHLADRVGADAPWASEEACGAIPTRSAAAPPFIQAGSSW